MLHDRYAERLQALLIHRRSWQPHPADSGAWSRLPRALRASYLQKGEEALAYGWPALPATVFLEFVRAGDRAHYEALQMARRKALCALVLAECVDGEGRFLDAIANGVWVTCEESFWGLPAHLYAQKQGPGLPDVEDITVDLFAGEALGLLAWTHYLLGERLDNVSPMIRPRIVHEAERRVLRPCLERDDFWWMGFRNHPLEDKPRVNNWTPWICSNWLAGALLLEDDSACRVAAIRKILRILDVFIHSYHGDGGCDEGPSYWNHAAGALFDSLELLHSATGGGVDIFAEPVIQNMGRYIYRAQIADNYFVNFADASALLRPPPSLLFRYGKAIGDPHMTAMGAWAAREQKTAVIGPEGSLGRQLPALFSLPALLETPPAQPLPRDVWLGGIQFFAARDTGGSAEGFFVAAKGGHNGESHNHNDVGNVIVYRDGKPLLVDAGVETYSAKTFGQDRYTLWTMQSAYHTLPVFNETQQSHGRQFSARDPSCQINDEEAVFEVDIAGAYPPEAGVESCVRSVTLRRGLEVVIVDEFVLDHHGGPMTMHLLTPCGVDVLKGVLHLRERPLGRDRRTGVGTVRFDESACSVTIERISISDPRLGRVWGDHLKRIIFTRTQNELHGTLRFHISQ